MYFLIWLWIYWDTCVFPYLCSRGTQRNSPLLQPRPISIVRGAPAARLVVRAPSVWGPPWGVPGLPGGSGDSLRCLLISVLLWLLFLLGKLSDLCDLGVFLRSICCTFTADKWTKDFHAVLADSCSMGGKPGLLRIVFWCGFPLACVLLCVFHINSAQVSC